uniref:DUF8039 domain-containing protein n=2 Tax=Oryza sativa subsp. japonica TaxID=39947 RepID=Q8LI60_ORYSJ|nr:hypothetical protein [Oryza sativa Japonica Group]
MKLTPTTFLPNRWKDQAATKPEAEATAVVRTTASSKPKKRRVERGKNMLLKEVSVLTRMSEIGEPLSPEYSCSKYSNQCGAVVRDIVEITWKDWKKVPESRKNSCWTSLQSKFEYPEGTDDDKAKDYALITQAQWDEFVALKTSAEEKEKSQKMAELARRNEYPHHLGSTGYRQAVKKWAKQDEEMEKAGKPDQKLKEVAVKMKNIVMQQQAGTFVPDRDRDELIYALGKPEHSGYVRGVSSKTSWKDGFKQDAYTYKKCDRYKEEIDSQARAAARDECNIYWSQNMMHGRRFHCQDIPDDYVKVVVRTVIEAYRMHELDFPTTEQIVYLGDAVDQFILWHKNDIELGSTDGIDRPPRISVSPSRPPVVASPRDSPIASRPRPEPLVASPSGPEPPVASPPRPEPPVASPRNEKDAEEQSVLAKQQSQLAIQEMSPAQPSEPVQAEPTKLAAGEIEAVPEQPMPDQPEQSQSEPSQPEEPKGADVPVMVRTHKHKAKSASKKHYMVTAFRGRDKDIVNAEFDNRKLKGFKQTFDDYLNYINSPDVPHEFENGKPFIYDWQLREGP